MLTRAPRRFVISPSLSLSCVRPYSFGPDSKLDWRSKLREFKESPPTRHSPSQTKSSSNYTSRHPSMADSQTGHPRARSPTSADTPPPTKKPRVEATDPNNPEDTAKPSPIPKPNPTKKNPNKLHKKKKIKGGAPEPCSADDVLWKDIVSVLGEAEVATVLEEGREKDPPVEFREEVECVVRALGSGGDGIAVLSRTPTPTWGIIVPLTLPGERVRVRVYRHARMHSFADLLEVLEPNTALRDDSLVQCRYFGECSGCQYQMLDYETQLALKRSVIEKAYRNYCDVPASLIPAPLSTIPSPKSYGYRTKLTPHFDPPRASASTAQDLRIGFNRLGTRKSMDIEECPIATPVINKALTPVRRYIKENVGAYKKGVTLIFRDSLEVEQPAKGGMRWDEVVRGVFEEGEMKVEGRGEEEGDMHVDAPGVIDAPAPAPSTSDVPLLTIEEKAGEEGEKHMCVTSHKGTVRERVGPFLFDYYASSFFQNNNAVLVPLVEYVREAIFGPATSSPGPASVSIAVESESEKVEKEEDNTKPTHLVDTYCGAGLFSISLSPSFRTITGIELSPDSIRSATHNATLNSIPPSKISFRAGDAAEIFSTVQDFPREKTVVVIDPPRKGCDEAFLRQLVQFRAGWVVYVSCNVHTQARDLGWILRESGAVEGTEGGYNVESLRGFDLFPQTAHVESVAVLRRIS